MRILILYNVATEPRIGLPEDLECEREITIIVPLVAEILRNCGHDVSTLETNLNLWEELKKGKEEIDLVFNLAEGFGKSNTDEAVVPSMLEALQIPFTGASSRNMHFTLDKEKTRAYLSCFGIPGPRYQLFRDSNESLSKGLRFPLIVKPVRTEASIGIHKNSVVADEVALLSRVREVVNTYRQPALVEEFVEGREISVGVVGNRGDLEVFPPLEFLFPGTTSPREQFRCYEYKWGGNKETMIQAVLQKPLYDEVTTLSRRAFVLCECQDYARFDFRVTGGGSPLLLEVNYNPGIGPNTHGLNNTLTMMASLAGLSYSQFIRTIVKISLTRHESGRM